ncbi:MAG: GNAT family N-acetyltransferase [Actinomycetota bacterium]|nr:GNAT family N-acetyltransferase [Actinomycetota bacterium]
MREPQREDAGDLTDLLSQLGYPASQSELERRLEAIDHLPDDLVLVVEAAGELVAVASLHIGQLFHLDGRWGRITSVVVREEWRHQGIGRQLLGNVEEMARARGCVLLGVTSGDWREDAHEFYRRMGYEEAGRQFLKRV